MRTFWLVLITESVNGSTTQILVWLVSKRFYESALPVKKLELRMSAEMEEEKIDMIESESEREALLNDHKAELQR